MEKKKDGRKWVVAAIITVVVLALVAAALVGVLAVQMYLALDGDADYEEQERPALQVEDIPETEPVEGPALMEPAGEYRLGLILADGSDFSAQMSEAFAQTCAELGVPAEVMTVTSGDPNEAYEYFLVMVDSGVSAVAMASMDAAYTEEMALIAKEMGVAFISLDTAGDVPLSVNAQVNIECWGSTSDIANQLLYIMAEGTDFTGKFGVIAPVENDPIVEEMEAYIGYMDELKNVVWKASGHGDGSDQSCLDSASYMLQTNKNLDAIICTDPQTTLAAAQVISENGYDVKLYGFGIPSQLKDYMPDGIVHYHDPILMGEMTARALLGLLDGSFVPADGVEFVLPGDNSYRVNLFNDALILSISPLFITKESVADLADLY